MRPTLLLLALLAALLPTSVLAQATGILDVQANVEPAWVILDGEPAGQTPYLEIVPAGRHTVTIRRDGFEEYSETINLKADTSIEIRANLVRVEPGLAVTVDVDDASVALDGKEIGVGRTVILDPAPRGTHELTVEAAGYGEWRARVNLSPGVVTPVEVNLRGSLGAIAVSTKPDGAMVSVDGEQKGEAPIKIEPLAPGAHGVRIDHAARSTVLQQVVVDPGKTVELNTRLIRESGALEVKPTVADARVLVNGVEIGRGKVAIENLRPGTYSVRVTAPDHTDFIKSVVVEQDKSVSVTARLESFQFDGGRTRRLAGGPPGGEPVTKKPGFWAAIGGGVGAAVAVGVIAGVAASQDDGGGTAPGTNDQQWQRPPSDVALTLP